LTRSLDLEGEEERGGGKGLEFFYMGRKRRDFLRAVVFI